MGQVWIEFGKTLANIVCCMMHTSTQKLGAKRCKGGWERKDTKAELKRHFGRQVKQGFGGETKTQMQYYFWREL